MVDEYRKVVVDLEYRIQGDLGSMDDVRPVDQRDDLRRELLDLLNDPAGASAIHNALVRHSRRNGALNLS